MRIACLFVSCLMTAAAFAAQPTPSVPARLPPADETWIEHATKNFTLFSSVSGRRTARIARGLETLREVLRLLSPRAKSMTAVAPVPTLVYVFESDRALQAHWDGPTVSGFFGRRQEANYVAVSAENEGGLKIVRHEYLHHYLANNFARVPLWLDEGLAEFFSTMSDEGDAAQLGHPPGERMKELSQGGLMSVQRLVGVTHDAPEYNHDAQRGGFYATSWLLVHYLFVGSEPRRGQIGAYLAALDRGDDAEATFRAVFGGDTSVLDRELRAYLQRIGKAYPYLKLKFADLRVDDSAATVPLTRVQLLARLGVLLSVGGRPDDSRRFLDAADALEKGSPVVELGYGVLAASAGGFDDAAARFRRAADGDPRDQAAQYMAGLYTIGASSTGHGGADPLNVRGDASRAAAARVYVERSLALAPGHPDSLALLGLTIAMDPTADVARGIEALERAHGALPTRWDVSMNLAQLYVRGQKTDRAREVLREVVARCPQRGTVDAAGSLLRALDTPTARGSAVAMAPQLLTPLRTKVPAAPDPAVDLFTQAMAALARQDRDAAAVLLRQVIEQAKDPHLAATAQQTLREFEERRCIDLYNQAVTRSNAGDVTGAIPLVREVAEKAPQSDLRERARALLVKWGAAAGAR